VLVLSFDAGGQTDEPAVVKDVGADLVTSVTLDRR
jgi:hypothetical protein